MDNSTGGGGGGGSGEGAEAEAGARAWAATDPESFLRENLSLTDLVSLAYMFNFVEAGVLGLGERKAVVQVKAGRVTAFGCSEGICEILECDTCVQ